MSYFNENSVSVQKKTRYIKLVMFLIISFVMTLSFFSLQTQPTEAAVNKYINYQGKLLDTNGIEVSDGYYHMRFKIYNSNSGGLPLWTETWNNTSQLATVDAGLFSLKLGSINTLNLDFASEDEYWLSVEIGGSGGTPSWDGEMDPRKEITAVAYAMNSDLLDGKSEEEFADLDEEETITGKYTHDITSATGDALTLKLTTVTDAVQNAFAVASIDAVQNSTDNDHLYGLYVADLQGTADDGNEYAIYQQGTAWDYGLYVEDNAKFNANIELENGAIFENAISGQVTLNSHFLPTADDTYDLGSSDARWADAYFDGTVYVDSASLYVDGGNFHIKNSTPIYLETSANIYASDDFYPMYDDKFNLGAGSRRWNDLHYSGRIESPAHGADAGLNLPTNAGAPGAVAGTVEGDIVWDETSNDLYVYDGLDFVITGGLWKDAGEYTYLTAVNDDLVVGSTASSDAPLYFDTSEFNLRIGSGDTTNAILTMRASNDAEGTITYATEDRWLFEDGALYVRNDGERAGDFYVTSSSGVNRAVMARTDSGSPSAHAGYFYAASSDGSARALTTLASSPNAWSGYFQGGQGVYVHNDLFVGSNTSTAPFYVDESANSVRIGDGVDTNASISMYADNGDTGTITYGNTDRWEFTGADKGIYVDNYLSFENTSTALGDNALVNNAGSLNIAIGFNSLQSNVGGQYNVSVGPYALEDNISGVSNVGIGNSALRNATGDNNVGVGFYSLSSNINGSGNVALGTYAGARETGSDTLYIDNQLRDDLADGRESSMIYGEFAAATADQKLRVNAELEVQGNIVPFADDTYSLGSSDARWQDLYLGPSTLHIGADNTNEATFSYHAGDLYVDTVGNLALQFPSGNKVGIGTDTPVVELEVNGGLNIDYTTNETSGNIRWTGSDFEGYDGSQWQSLTFGEGDTLWTDAGAYTYLTATQDDLVVGSDATSDAEMWMDVSDQRLHLGDGYIDFDDSSVAVGQDALESSTGLYNTAVGFESLTNNTGGQWNVGLGYYALQSNATGDYNVGVGAYSLKNNVSGDYNIALGYRSSQGNVSGDHNIALGTYTLFNNSSGSYNTAIGYYALNDTNGSYNLALGNRAGQNETGGNKLYIDNLYRGSTETDNREKSMIYGEFASATADQKLRVNAELEVQGNIVPFADDTYSLGFSDARWQDLYLGPSSIYIGTHGNDYEISYNSSNEEIVFNEGSSDKDFRVEADGVSKAFFVQGSDGNVGIGDINPVAALVVGDDTNAEYANGVGDVYIQKNLEVSAPSYFNDIQAGGDIFPSDDDTYDLGSLGVRWQNGFFSNGVSVGDTLQISDGGFHDTDSSIRLSTQGDNDDYFEFDTISDQMYLKTAGGSDLYVQPAGDQLTFQNDIDAAFGVRFLDADGGTPILNIDTTNERVGIGDSSPDEELHVVDTGGASYLQAVFEGVSNSPGGIKLKAGTGQEYEIQTTHSTNGDIANGFAIYDRTDTAYRFVINDDGDVGIGTTDPDYQLQISRAAGGQLSLERDDLTIVDGNSLGGINFIGQDSDSSNNGGAILLATATDTWGSDYIQPSKLLFYTQNRSSGNAFLYPMMNLYEDVGLGIGLHNGADPESTLHIATNKDTGSALRIQAGLGVAKYYDFSLGGTGELTFSPDAGSDIVFDENGDIGVGITSPGAPVDILSDTSNYAIRLEENSGGENWQIGVDNQGDLNFYNDGVFAMTMDDSGRLGVGVSAPNNKIEVDGLINFDSSTYSTALGQEAGNNFIAETNDNTAIGYRAMYSDAIGDYNTAIGNESLYNNGSDYNTAVGYRSLYYNESGSRNVGLGVYSLRGNSSGMSGGHNIGIGYLSGRDLISGDNNVGVGSYSIYNTQTGSDNSALGYRALYSTTGSGNVALGSYAGYDYTGSNAFFVNNQDRLSSAGDQNESLIYGEFAASSADQVLALNASVGIGDITPDGKLEVRQYEASDSFNIYDGTDLVFTVEDGGFVGIGPTNPNAPLHIETDNSSLYALSISEPGFGDEWTFGVDTNGDLNFYDDLTLTHVFENGGDVGIGVTNPDTELDVHNLIRVQRTSGTASWPSTGEGMELAYNKTSHRGYVQVYDRDTDTWGDIYMGEGDVGIGTIAAHQLDVADDDGSGTYAARIWNNGATSTSHGLIIQAGLDASQATATRFIQFRDGNGDAGGYVRGDGSNGVSYQTTGSDYAEYFYTNNTDLIAAEIVCVDTNLNNAVKRCTSSADNNLIGVISTSPGFVGNGVNNENDPNYKLVALTGQVPVKVNDENGAISRGDYLTSSSTPGEAMKADADDPTVGVALEPLASGSGSIQVVISRNNGGNADGSQWADGTNGLYYNDLATIIGPDSAFSYVSDPASGDLQVADDFEAGDDGYFGGDLIVGASTSATETLANAGFAQDGDDLFVAGDAGVEGNVYTDGSFIAGPGTTTYSDGSIHSTSSMDISTGAGEDLVLNSGSGTLNLGTGTNEISNTDAGADLTLNSNGDINFFNSNNSIDSGGNLNLAGTAAFSGGIQTSGDLAAGDTLYGENAISATSDLTISSGSGQDLVLDSDSGALKLGAGTNEILNTDASADLTINSNGEINFFNSNNSMDASGNLNIAGTLQAAMDVIAEQNMIIKNQLRVDEIAADDQTMIAVKDQMEFEQGISISQKTDYAGSATQVNTDGFGDSNNENSYSAAVYNGKLYVGTKNSAEGAELWAYDGSSWASEDTAGFGNASNDSINSLIAHAGRLFAGTNNSDKAQIWTCDDSGSCVQENLGAGFDANNDSVSAIAVHNGRLYVGTDNPTDNSEVWQFVASGDWTAADDVNGFTNSSNNQAVSALLSNNSQLDNAGLLAATRNSNGAEIWKYEGNDVWTQIADSGAANTEAMSMTSYNGQVFVGTKNSNGCLVYKQGDGLTDWDQAGSAGLLDSAYTECRALAVYNGNLFALLGKTSGAGSAVAKYDPIENTWSGIYANAADSAGYWLQVFSGKLYFPIQSSGQLQVYEYEENSNLSNSVEFEANGETAALYFKSDAAGNANIGQESAGAFIMTHTLITNSGSYDLAEDWPTEDPGIEAGDVVGVDPFNKAHIIKGSNENSPVGIISTEPGYVLSQKDDGRIYRPVALAGRVPVKITDENGPVMAGDLLTPSSTPGYAMKLTGSGPVIGKALEDYDFKESGDSEEVARELNEAAEQFDKIKENNLKLAEETEKVIEEIDKNKQEIEQIEKDANMTAEQKQQVKKEKEEVLANDVENIAKALEIDEEQLDSIEKVDKVENKVKEKVTELEKKAQKAVIAKVQLIKPMDKQYGKGRIMAMVMNSYYFDVNKNDNLGQLADFDERTASADERIAENKVVDPQANIPADFAEILTVADSDFLEVRGNLRVFGDLYVTGNIYVDGNTEIKGDLSVGGKMYVSKDMSGTAVIASADQTAVKVKFESSFEQIPRITVTPELIGLTEQENIFEVWDGRYVITNKSTEGFTVNIAEPLCQSLEFEEDQEAVCEHGLRFDWLAFGVIVDENKNKNEDTDETEQSKENEQTNETEKENQDEPNIDRSQIQITVLNGANLDGSNIVNSLKGLGYRVNEGADTTGYYETTKVIRGVLDIEKEAVMEVYHLVGGSLWTLTLGDSETDPYKDSSHIIIILGEDLTKQSFEYEENAAEDVNDETEQTDNADDDRTASEDIRAETEEDSTTEQNQSSDSAELTTEESDSQSAEDETADAESPEQTDGNDATTDSETGTESTDASTDGESAANTETEQTETQETTIEKENIENDTVDTAETQTTEIEQADSGA